jgi:hypothetical protein
LEQYSFLRKADVKQNMLSMRSVSKMLALIAIVLLAARRLYYVQEMLAALILFAVLFCCIVAALTSLYVLDRAAEGAISFLESRTKELLQHGLNGKIASWARLP